MGANEHLRLRRAIAFLWKVIVVFTLGIAMSRLPSRQALQCPKCCAGPMNKGADTYRRAEFLLQVTSARPY